MRGGYFALKMQFFCVFVTSVYTHTHTHTHTHTRTHTHRCLHVHTILVTSLLCLYTCNHTKYRSSQIHTISFTYHSSHSSTSLYTHNYTYSSSQIISHHYHTKHILTHTPHYPPTLFVRHLPGVWKCGSRKVGMGVTSGRALLKASIKSRRIQSRAKRPLVVAILPLDWFLPPLAFITFRYTLFCNRHQLAVDHTVYFECPKLPFFMPLELIVCEAMQSEIK